MVSFLLYQFKVALCIIVFTGAYYLLFRKETFHRFNRFYLIGTIILSIVLPAMQFSGLTVNNAVSMPYFVEAVTVYAGKVVVTPQQANPISLLVWIYTGIALLFMAYLMFQLTGLLRLTSKREIIPMGHYRIIILPENTRSFSFFNLIFLGSLEKQRENDDPVLQHELAHARQWHSFDILLIQVIKIFQWFNPFVYLTEKALQETHEYLADAAVLEQDSQSGRYRQLLLTQVFGVQPGIFSFFNYSLIKNRLVMMTKEKSPMRNRLKYLFVLPLVSVMGLLMCSTAVKSQEPEKPVLKENGKVISKEVIATDEIATSTDKEPVFVAVEVEATFQGGDIQKFREWVQKNLVYPPDAVKNGIFGKVLIQFSVDSKGKVRDVKVLRGVAPSLDEESARVVKSSPDWVPAKQKGKNVTQQFVIPVFYTLQ